LFCFVFTFPKAQKDVCYDNLTYRAARDHFSISSFYDIEYYREKLPHRIPMAFEPDLLRRHSKSLEHNASDLSTQPILKDTISSDVLHTEFYLTTTRDPAEFDMANIHPDLQPCLNFGRPNIPRIFQQAQLLAATKDEKRIAVMVCGPIAMINDVEECARIHSNNGLVFDVHHEVFEF
jgi:hypothetical protein